MFLTCLDRVKIVVTLPKTTNCYVVCIVSQGSYKIAQIFPYNIHSSAIFPVCVVTTEKTENYYGMFQMTHEART